MKLCHLILLSMTSTVFAVKSSSTMTPPVHTMYSPRARDIDSLVNPDAVFGFDGKDSPDHDPQKSKSWMQRTREDIKHPLEFQLKYPNQQINGFHLRLEKSTDTESGQLFLTVFLSYQAIEIACTAEEATQYEAITDMNVTSMQQFRVSLIQKYVRELINSEGDAASPKRTTQITTVMIGFMYQSKSQIWRKRWFVLMSDGYLYRYEGHGDTVFKELPLNLKYSLDLKLTEYGDEFPYGIELKLPCETWKFACNTMDESLEWMRQLQNIRGSSFDTDE